MSVSVFVSYFGCEILFGFYCGSVFDFCFETAETGCESVCDVTYLTKLKDSC